jgi:hypothetical protein
MHIFTEAESLAVQARLNFILGAKIYDTYFVGLRCDKLSEGVGVVYARSEFFANQIADQYSSHVAIAIESVVRKPVKQLQVLACRNKVP